MEIKTKFNIGDTVYAVDFYNNKEWAYRVVGPVEIVAIETYVSWQTTVIYTIMPGSTRYHESKIFISSDKANVLAEKLQRALQNEFQYQ
jgi:hypothetical protein